MTSMSARFFQLFVLIEKDWCNIAVFFDVFELEIYL
jgi:hypothetical protein